MAENLEEYLRKYISSYKEETEEITFSEYLEKVKKDPTIAALAHKRVFDMIESHGVKEDEETGDVTYDFFESELFGIEESTKQIMEYFKAASIGSEVGRRFLLLYGPPSSGKSCLLTMIKNGLEKWSHEKLGAMYSIKGCPMQEQPLNAIPQSLRKNIKKDLGVNIDKEASLCPRCSHRLREEYNGDFMKFEIERKYVSQNNRVGIGTFAPSDPKSQDISELIGGIDLSKIAEYGDESDPRAYKFNGELNIANRGLIEFIEILKVDQKFLYVLLTATQEKQIKTPRYPLLYIDLAIISHTNESEYKEFVGNPKNEALIDRMIVCKVPYNLKVDEEVKIYEKLFAQGETDNVHVAPHTFKVAAIFAILSRLEDAKEVTLDKVKKMKLYNGEEVEGFSLKDVPRLRREQPNEGMDGASPRYIINRLITTAIRAPEGTTSKGEKRKKYVTPVEAIRALRDGLETSSKFKPEQKDRYHQLLHIAKKELDSIARNEVQKAFFVSFETEARTMLNNYLDNIEAYLEGTKIEDPITHEELEPDNRLMRSIESKIGVSESQQDSFRNEIFRKVAVAARDKGEKFRYEHHSRLREAIEKELFEQKRDVINMTISTRTLSDPEQLKRLNDVIKTLCDQYGYIEESANDLLKYVSSIMSREK